MFRVATMRVLPCRRDDSFVARGTPCVGPATFALQTGHAAGSAIGYRRAMNCMTHILVVDDDEEILSLLTGFFRKHAHRVTVATGGPAMFEAVDRLDVD